MKDGGVSGSEGLRTSYPPPIAMSLPLQKTWASWLLLKATVVGAYGGAPVLQFTYGGCACAIPFAMKLQITIARRTTIQFLFFMISPCLDSLGLVNSDSPVFIYRYSSGPARRNRRGRSFFQLT